MTASAQLFAHIFDRIIEQATKLLSTVTPLADGGFFHYPATLQFLGRMDRLRGHPNGAHGALRFFCHHQ